METPVKSFAEISLQDSLIELMEERGFCSLHTCPVFRVRNSAIAEFTSRACNTSAATTMTMLKPLKTEPSPIARAAGINEEFSHLLELKRPSSTKSRHPNTESGLASLLFCHFLHQGLAVLVLLVEPSCEAHPARSTISLFNLISCRN